MNTEPQGSQPSEEEVQVEHTEEDDGEVLLQLLEELDSINESSEEAPLNKSSIDDNNGGRIDLQK